MRKLMALAIVLVVAGATRSYAALGMGDITFDGSLEVSGNSADNEVNKSAANDHRGNTATRLRLGMNAQVTEGVKGRIEIIRSPQSAGSDALYGGTQSTSDGVDLVDEQNNLDIHNAYVEFDNLWGNMFRLGRQYVGNPGDLVWNISPTDDDSLTPNSIDGLAIQNRKWDFINIDFFTGKAAEDDGVADTDATDAGGDVNLSSLDLIFPKLVPGAKLNAGYLWGRDSNNSSNSDDNTLTTIRVGINGGVKENFLTYRAEYLMNGGQFEGNGATAADDQKYKGTALDLGVGLNPADTGVGGFSIWANLLMASGDDDTATTGGANEDKSFHDFTALGFNTSDRLMGEIFGKSNTLTSVGPIGTKGVPLGQGADTGSEGRGLEVINFGASWKPKFIEKTSVRLDYFMFGTAESTVNNVDVGDSYGNEIDLTLTYAQSDNVNIEGGYAMFSPDDALIGVNATNDEDITKLFARLKVKWGGEGK